MKIRRKLICLILMVLFLFGCTRNNEQNHKRYNFENVDEVNQFLMENIVVTKIQKIRKSKTYLLTILNNSDYYINNVNLDVYFDNAGYYIFQNVALRPGNKTQLLVQQVKKKPRNKKEIYFKINQDDNDLNNLKNLFTLESSKDIIYANDIEVSNNVPTAYSQTFNIIINNKTDTKLSIWNYDIILYDNIGNLDFPGDSYDYSDSDDYCITVGSQNSIEDFSIITTGDLLINKDLKILFSGGQQCSCSL